MDALNTCMLGARYLSQIQEESDSREQSTCFLPPVVQQEAGGAGEQGAGEVGAGEPGAGEPGAGEPGEAGAGEAEVEEADRQEVSRLSAVIEQQRKLEEDGALLEELCRIEAELRDSLLPDVDRQQESDFLRREKNFLLRTHLCYLSLGQRVAKPWVSSYFRKFPMHIYCLPVQAANHRSRRRGLAGGVA